jgi:hypothetical protein
MAVIINSVRFESKKADKNTMEKIEEKCPHCEEQKMKEAESEEMNFAVLVALVPMLVMTLFGQVGLF